MIRSGTARTVEVMERARTTPLETVDSVSWSSAMVRTVTRRPG